MSILNDTKHNLNIPDSVTEFDLDVMTAINSALSVLDDLGVGPDGGFFITDNTDDWDALGLPPNQLHQAKTYILLKAKLLFDPPTTSFLLAAMEKQIKEHEWRLNVKRELLQPDPYAEEEEAV